MKKWVWILLSLFMVGGLSAQDQQGVEVTVARNAKLRDGPGVEWVVLSTVEAGTIMRLDGRAPYETIWVRGITPDGQIGWIFGELINASYAQLSALPKVWVDDPFMGVPPQPQAAPVQPVSGQPTVTPAPANTPVAPAVSAAPARNSSVISGISANARAIFQRGQQLGNRANVFSKVGDSITAAQYFLFPIGWGTYNLRGYSSLQGVVNYFSTEAARDNNNSFANPSLVAYNGLSTRGALDPSVAWGQVCESGETPLECEYRIVRPSVALIMLGTNDMSLMPLETYRAHLERIVQISIDRGVIPVLSYIPMREGYADSVAVFNQTIASVARAYDVPLWNYASAMQNLDASGLGDGIHPSFPPGEIAAAADFTPENLRYGYTVRNLTALQVLDAIWRQVMR